MAILINMSNKTNFLAFLTILYQIILNHYNYFIKLLFIKEFLNFKQIHFMDRFIIFLILFNNFIDNVLHIFIVLLTLNQEILILMPKFN